VQLECGPVVSGSILCKGRNFGQFHETNQNPRAAKLGVSPPKVLVVPRVSTALDPKVGNKADGSLDYVKAASCQTKSRRNCLGAKSSGGHFF